MVCPCQVTGVSSAVVMGVGRKICPSDSVSRRSKGGIASSVNSVVQRDLLQFYGGGSACWLSGNILMAEHESDFLGEVWVPPLISRLILSNQPTSPSDAPVFVRALSVYHDAVYIINAHQMLAI